MNGTTIFLIRHAEAEVNTKLEYIVGRSNWAELTKNGIKQATALGNYFAEKKLHFDPVYCSSAIRTQQTARYCFNAMGEKFTTVKVTSKILELDQGDWEGKLRNEIYQREDVRKNLDADNWNFIPGDHVKGESQNTVALRMKKWLLKKVYEHEGKSIIAFTHGLAIKLFLTEIFERERSNAYKARIDNTSITILNYQQGEFTLVTENDSTHLK